MTTFCWLPPDREVIRASGPDGLDPDVGHPPGDVLAFGLASDELVLHRRQQAGQRQVPADRHHLDQAVALAVLGHQTHAQRDPLLDLGAAQVDAVQQHPSTRDGVTTGQRLHQLGPPRSHQPVQADDLAAPDVQRDVVHHHPAGVGLGDRHALDGQCDIAVVTGLVAEVVVGLPTDHLSDDPGQVDVLGLLGGDQVTVAEDHCVVGDLDRFLEVVGDVDDRHPVRGQVPDDLEQHLHLARTERGGGFVHDQDAGVGGEGPGDLDDLLLPDPEILDQGARPDRLLHPLHQLGRDVPLAPVVDPPGPGPRARGR